MTERWCEMFPACALSHGGKTGHCRTGALLAEVLSDRQNIVQTCNDRTVISLEVLDVGVEKIYKLLHHFVTKTPPFVKSVNQVI